MPVATAYRDGFDLPMEVAVAGKVIAPLPVFDDRSRIVGQIYEQPATPTYPAV